MTVDYTQSPQAPPPPQRGWWSRNWKWVVPAGCGGCLLIVGAFVAIILVVVFGAIRSSDVYKGALTRAQSDPRVVAALGTPIEAGMIVGGNVNVNGGTGNAEINFPISGPKGKATVYAEARKSAGDWQYSVLTVKLADGSSIDLLTR